MKTKILCSSLMAIFATSSIAFAADPVKQPAKKAPAAHAADKKAVADMPKGKQKLSLKEALAKVDKRSVAADSPLEVKLSDADLRKQVLAMRYCDVSIDGDYVSTFTFHRNGVLSQKQISDGAAANAYNGDAYKGDGYSGDAYENDDNAYEAAANDRMPEKGVWSIAKGKVYFKFANDVRMLRLSKNSFKQHRCYIKGVDVR